MATASSKGPKMVSSRSQGLHTAAVAPHFWGWCGGVLPSSPPVWRRSSPASPLSAFCLPWWWSPPRSALLSGVFPRKGAVSVRGWGVLRRYSEACLGADSPGQSAAEATDAMTPLKQECAKQEARPAAAPHRGVLVCWEVWGVPLARVCRGDSFGSPRGVCSVPARGSAC